MSECLKWLVSEAGVERIWNLDSRAVFRCFYTCPLYCCCYSHRGVDDRMICIKRLAPIFTFSFIRGGFFFWRFGLLRRGILLWVYCSYATVPIPCRGNSGKLGHVLVLGKKFPETGVLKIYGEISVRVANSPIVFPDISCLGEVLCGRKFPALEEGAKNKYSQRQLLSITERQGRKCQSSLEEATPMTQRLVRSFEVLWWIP